MHIGLKELNKILFKLDKVICFNKVYLEVKYLMI